MIRPRRWARWNHGIREIAFIVAGVLIALAGNSWWQDRLERRAERGYLRQLLDDTRANEQILRAAIRSDSVTQDRNADLLRALQQRNPPADSVLNQWMSGPNGGYSDPRPRLGTVASLLQTGEVRLLRNDSTRSLLIGYGSEMDTDLAELSRSVDMVLEGEKLLLSRYAVTGLAIRFTTAEVGYREDEQKRFIDSYITNWKKLQLDAGVRSGLEQILVGQNIRIFYLGRMLAATQSIRRSLENQVGF